MNMLPLRYTLTTAATTAPMIMPVLPPPPEDEELPLHVELTTNVHMPEPPRQAAHVFPSLEKHPYLLDAQPAAIPLQMHFPWPEPHEPVMPICVLASLSVPRAYDLVVGMYLDIH